MADVREHRHRDTRDSLYAAAIALFGRRGFTAVTVEEIAAAAGVSRRTAYRRFRSKDDILLEMPRRWLAAFDRATVGLTGPAGVRAGSLAVSSYIDDHRADTLVGLRALADAPSLNGASVAHDDWHDRVVGLLVADGFAPTRASMLAGAYLGGVNSMVTMWAGADGASSLVEMNETLDDLLCAIW
ncbi:MAG: TetR/AcrR family transcriptional regulator [Ilumatobacter sp.]